MSQPIDFGPGVPTKIRVRPQALAATDRPTVTVVIPCFNYARYLPVAVESALSQGGVDVDVVIVDDCSTDDSLAVAHRLEAQNASVKVLAHEVNQGPVATFNDGLRLVSGQFLVRLDADDLLTPNSLQRATALARRYPSVGLVYGHPVHFASDVPAPRQGVRSWTVWPGRHWLADRCRTGLNVITAPEAVMRTSLVERLGGQLELAHTHDMEMWLRIAAFSDVGRVNGPDQAWHREHDDSLSARKVDYLKDLRERWLAFDTLFAGPAGDLAEAPALRRLAHRAIAREALRRASYLYDRGRVDDALVRELREVASEVAPFDAVADEWRGLDRRMELGTDRVRRRPWSIGAVIQRRLEHEINSRLWTRTGSYGRSMGLRKLGNA